MVNLEGAMSEWTETAQRCLREIGGVETSPGVFEWEGEPAANIPHVRVVLQESDEAVLELYNAPRFKWFYEDCTADLVALCNRIERLQRVLRK